MSTELTISRETPSTAFDHRELYALGLEHIQKLSGKVWTDFNVHDPGVTILELLCFALTDLSYRAAFPVEDLLAQPTSGGAPAKPLFTAAQILPNRPLTLLDYRKLLIDLPGVCNAWLWPSTDPAFWVNPGAGELSATKPGAPGAHRISFGGLYDVLLDLAGPQASNPTAVQAEVVRVLQENRNLCEDFVRIGVVKTEPFLLCCELEIEPQADAGEVLTAVLFAVQECLAPFVRNYSLSEILAKPWADGSARTVDEVFDGPLLSCGFIDEEELDDAELKTEIHLSDVISVIMDVAGVVAVRSIVLNPANTSEPLANKWRVPVVGRKKPELDALHSNVVLFKRDILVVVDRAAAVARYKALWAEAIGKTEVPALYDRPVPEGRFRDPATYVSFQNHFPAIYGIGEAGLDSTATDARKVQALQLKGYLLFFDQLLANYVAQLASVRDLLASDPALQRTSFARVVDSFRDWRKIYASAPLTGTDDAARAVVQGVLDDLVEDGPAAVQRRNRFLDHLIARFAEEFTDLGHVLYSAFGLGAQHLTAIKCDFLNTYPRISAERSLAFNAALTAPADLWDTANVSGFERRLAKLLGLRDPIRRDLLAPTFDCHAVVEAAGAQFAFRFAADDTGDTVLTGAAVSATREAAHAAAVSAGYAALLPANYRRTTAAGRFSFELVDAAGAVLARPPADFATEAARDAAIAGLVNRFDNDGLYVVENILLRPAAAGDPFLRICPDPNCDDCAEEEDPYSYRIHVVLPAFSTRFANLDFRRHVEQVIRAETPAHLLPKICWIGRDDMKRFQRAYRDWLHLRAGVDATNRAAKLAEIIAALFEVKNTYYAQRLAACDSTGPKFVLDRTVLGTLPPEGT